MNRIDKLACNHVDLVVAGECHKRTGRGDADPLKNVNVIAVCFEHRAVQCIACIAHFPGVVVNEHDLVALQHKHLGQLHSGEAGAYYEYRHCVKNFIVSLHSIGASMALQ